MAIKIAPLKNCPKCGAEPLLVERGSYLKATFAGFSPVKKTKAETFCVECACGFRPNFKSLDKKTALATWERISKS